ncbi:DUF4004 family protein [Clostridium botulinum]|uniref:DUF4004 family protein n=1 Tax=unclassified Clostridium TaxID=2614128 RepID=UPI0013C9A5C8|nr:MULTISPECIES: DUF4004 family protein [unclassified Clostridium]NFH73678.1 DUF4004 family protein [Clostridium botulinum]NFI01723.1 DUF4004 family protein [Clostridium botulinum]NFI64205.1 DUF4004 family protein [Clostridium botulinum]NFI81408.1 DUF4004 family protein [Clostridium botulinum]NFJ44554.1 DUF4004 family protein [Clostridium botulinum]
MFEELISKKELLEEMKISYGQLYRWKRKKIIPEEWFIKKSVSTGQETFFPRNKIINRINKILELKDEISLDDLANQFSYNVNNIKIKRTYLTKNNIIPLNIIERFELIINVNEEIYEQSRLFTLFVFEELIKIGFLSIDEVNEITLSVLKNYKSLNTKESILFIKRKLGVCFYYVLSNEPEILLDNSLIELTRIRMGDILEKIKKLN